MESLITVKYRSSNSYDECVTVLLISWCSSSPFAWVIGNSSVTCPMKTSINTKPKEDLAFPIIGMIRVIMLDGWWIHSYLSTACIIKITKFHSQINILGNIIWNNNLQFINAVSPFRSSLGQTSSSVVCNRTENSPHWRFDCKKFAQIPTQKKKKTLRIFLAIQICQCKVTFVRSLV